MTWNYRVVMIPADEDVAFSSDTFSIREVFYDEEGAIEFWSEEDATALGETFEELCDDYDNMTEAFNKPILMLVTDENGDETLLEIGEDDL